MNKLFKSLEQILIKDSRFVSYDWILLKNVIREQTDKLDEKLIILLLENEETKKVFFKNILDVLAFDSKKFLQYLNNKEFLPDSYTSFKNKIWLTNSNGDFIANSNEVVLNFPYKDCILAWWQDKEDVKRDEIFYNDILAREQIDVLLDKKVFTNFKKIIPLAPLKQEGIEKAPILGVGGNFFNRNENGTIKDNLIIKWNNLLALHSLKSNFSNKVKLIYIDPPYNTWNDSFGYNDKFNHSTWLTFMKNRLEIAKELLKDDWVIFVQCDDNEQAYLKVLMDEIFWRENFITTLHIEMSTTQWMKVASAQNWNIVKNWEYCLIFSKNWKKDIMINKIYDLRDFDNHYSYFFDGQRYCKLKEVLLENINIKKELEVLWILNKSIQDLYNLSPKVKNFIMDNSKNIFQDWNCEIQIDNETLSKINSNFPIKYNSKWKDYLIIKTWWWKNRQLISLNISLNYSNDIYNTYWITKIRWDFWKWYYLDMWNISKEWWLSFDNWKKSERLIKDIIYMTTNPLDIILDYHLWSWTTCAVAHKMWRQYIWIEQMDYIENISIERMKKVIEWEQGWISKSVNWQWWWEFIYMEIKKANQNFIDKIINSTSKDELIKIYTKIKESWFINYNIDIQKIDENIKDFEELSIINMQDFLIKLLDKNNLYVNFSELEDENNTISDFDKKLNKEFYKK